MAKKIDRFTTFVYFGFDVQDVKNDCGEHIGETGDMHNSHSSTILKSNTKDPQEGQPVLQLKFFTV